MTTKNPNESLAKKVESKRSTPAKSAKRAKPTKTTKSAKKLSKTTAGKPKKALRRKTYVRSSILELLKDKRMTRNQLLAAGGFAASALDRNLKLLRDDKLIEAEGTRPLLFGLVAGSSSPAAAEVKAPAPTPAKRKGAAAPAASRNSKLGQLNAALDQYNRRMAPKEQVSEKLLVLERLAEAASPPIADVLRAIQRDYAAA